MQIEGHNDKIAWTRVAFNVLFLLISIGTICITNSNNVTITNEVWMNISSTIAIVFSVLFGFYLLTIMYCGTVRLYNLKEVSSGGMSFYWTSFISKIERHSLGCLLNLDVVIFSIFSYLYPDSIPFRNTLLGLVAGTFFVDIFVPLTVMNLYHEIYDFMISEKKRNEKKRYN